MHRLPPPETYEHAVGVGKKVTVVALDYDRCAKMLTDGFQAPQRFGMAGRNSDLLADLLYGGMDRNRLNRLLPLCAWDEHQIWFF